jgi:hypothetical protein
MTALIDRKAAIDDISDARQSCPLRENAVPGKLLSRQRGIR